MLSTARRQAVGLLGKPKKQVDTYVEEEKRETRNAALTRGHRHRMQA
jgi:hypothetical protein